ncbi:hypothetical protein IKG49_01255 [Candidatus Saccharibacteria bacterium]|nr:hypothetical protein [Candidatus Saccharibacteria bacterium]
MAEIIKDINRKSSANIPDEEPWGEKYQRSIPAFDSERATELAKGEKLDRECAQTIRNLLGKETFNPSEEYNELVQYAQKRGERHGIKTPINIYLRYESWGKINDHSSGIFYDRYDPQTGNHYRGKEWGFGTRAYHSPKNGTFIDFTATPRGEEQKPREKQETVLGGYEKVDEIINFAYTVEHELQHDVQQQRLDSGEISYDALRTARDNVVLACLPMIKNGNYFYVNAHDDFFIEREANDSADDFLSKVLPVGGTHYESKFIDKNDPQKRLYKVGDILEQRAKEGRIGVGRGYTLTVDETTLKIKRKTYSGKAEEIISDLCDDLVRAYPGFLAKYPVLLLEYDSNGNRRKREDIEADMASIDNGENFSFGGKEADAKRLKTAYYRLLKHSKKFNPGSIIT